MKKSYDKNAATHFRIRHLNLLHSLCLYISPYDKLPVSSLSAELLITECNLHDKALGTAVHTFSPQDVDTATTEFVATIVVPAPTAATIAGNLEIAYTAALLLDMVYLAVIVAVVCLMLLEMFQRKCII